MKWNGNSWFRVVTEEVVRLFHIWDKYNFQGMNLLILTVVGNYQQALETYKTIHRKFPENIECKYWMFLFGVFHFFRVYQIWYDGSNTPSG